MKFKPTVDLHYHLDDMGPRAIKAVSDKHDLPWAGKSLTQIRELSQVEPGSNWEMWYANHTRVREAVFRKPEVFADVVREAVTDLEEENLDARILRFSLSMPMFCYKALHGLKPDFDTPTEKREFLDLLNRTIAYLISGNADPERTPLVFSISCQDVFLPILDDVVDIALNYSGSIVGTDLTNEPTHKLFGGYKRVISRLRDGGVKALTIHAGEKGENDGYSSHERIISALKLEPDTLGHAVYAMDDESVMLAIAKSGAVVELCPNSNLSGDFVSTMLGNDLTKYPLLTFQSYGIPCTINSDTPGSIGSTLAKEFSIVQRIFGLSDDDLRQLDNVARSTASRVYKINC